jgi:hypothetical protein
MDAMEISVVAGGLLLIVFVLWFSLENVKQWQPRLAKAACRKFG